MNDFLATIVIESESLLANPKAAIGLILLIKAGFAARLLWFHVGLIRNAFHRMVTKPKVLIGNTCSIIGCGLAILSPAWLLLPDDISRGIAAGFYFAGLIVYLSGGLVIVHAALFDSKEYNGAW